MKSLFKQCIAFIEGKQIFRRIGIFVENKRLYVIIVGLLLILPAGFGAMQVEMDTGYDTMISPDSKVFQDYNRFAEHFSDNVLAVLVTGENLTDLLRQDNMAAMDTVETEMAETENVFSVIGPVFMMEQIYMQQSGSAILPDNPNDLLSLILDPETGEINPTFMSVFPDENHALIAITLDGGLAMEEEEAVVDAAEESVTEAGFDSVEPLITGSPTVWSQVSDLMTKSMQNMFIVSIILMLLILVFIFHVRGFFAWRWLPLGVVFISIIYTFGLMGVISIPITMATMAVFPVVIGLGVDYAIQFHNRYDEEARRGETVADAIIDSITHIGPAIGIAIVTACLGFAALFFSPVPMVKDFGYMLIIGIVMCYLLAITFLLAILYTRDRRAKPVSEATERKRRVAKKNTWMIAAIIAGACGFVGSLFLGYPPIQDALPILIAIVVICYLIAISFAISKLSQRRRRGTARGVDKHMGFIERGLHRLAPFVIRKPLIIIPIALILTGAGLYADQYIETETDEMKFISQDVQVIQDIQYLQEVAGGFLSMNILLEADDVTEPEIINWVLQVEGRITAEQSDIVSATNSYASTMYQITQSMGIDMPETADAAKGVLSVIPEHFRINLVNADYTAANLIASINSLMGDDAMDLAEAMEEYTADPPAGVTVAVTGMPIVGNAMFDALTGGRMEMTLIGIGLVFLGLLILFKLSIIRALLAILPIALIIGWSSGIMYLLGIKYTPLTATMSALIIGIGVEFTILLMMRYFEERRKGEVPFEAMFTAMTKIGRAVIASGLTVIGGFGALLIARDFIILRDFGIVTMINVTFALLSTLIVLPPLIVWVDSFREKRRLRRSGE